MRIGVLSDTHLNGPQADFCQQAARAFAGVDIILHAGDLTERSVLEAFAGKQVHAVHGNMCRPSASASLPDRLEITIGDFRFALIHSIGHGYDFADRLVEVFPAADCIVFGHTHRPFCRRYGEVLLVNPGAFCSTGRFGAPGTFAVIEAGETLVAAIYEVTP